MPDSAADPTMQVTDRLTDLDGERAPRGPSRRRVLVSGGVIVAAAAATAACGSSEREDQGSDATPSDSAGAGGGTDIPATDVPLGGGRILAEQKVVVTQPTAGDFKAFTAVCTHQGCVVASIADGQIVCPCHGSKYSITDGAVTNGPATAPLAEVPITVSGDTITVT